MPKKSKLTLVLGVALLMSCGESIVAFPEADLDATPRQDLGARPDMKRDAPEMSSPPQDQPQDLSAPDLQAQPEDMSDLTDDMSDQGSPMFEGTPCSVDGRAGTCEQVSACVGDYSPTPGRCPGPAQIQCCTLTPKDPPPPPTGQCDPNAMPRPNEGLAQAPGQGGCPAGMVRVTPTLCIDQYEASLVEELPDGSERSWSPFFNPGTRTMRAVSIAAAIPQGYINADQAEAACQRAGKRLCTSQEWLRACQGPQGLTYPYGASNQPGVCHDARAKHPVVEYFNSTDPSIWSKLGHPCINQQAMTALRGDAKPGCVSAEGAYHMMGNLHEWVADASGTFRGGFYADTSRNGPGCLYRTTAHNRQHWDYSTGFRCCASQ